MLSHTSKPTSNLKRNQSHHVEGMSESNSSAAMMEDTLLDELCDGLKILSNPQRLKILIHLLRGETAVGELESNLKIKQPNLSHELRKLRDKNVVQTRRQSKVIFYSICDDNIRNMVSNIHTLTHNRSDQRAADQSIRVNHRIQNKSPSSAIGLGSVLGECAHFPVIRES